ncbi:hypothetical protein G3T20_05245 [Bordetella hinzii]|uniref:phage/plasmid replication domain-containing protein n=1 Tax=Bordetella hinzii TaxID=103855 RepID=UPI0013EFCE1E|nr:phage/plasmid replication protein [Bordetella hinzii]QII84158.1 hypothetical protein G3T20_05245 [Bordetella hinzii]
MNTNSLHLSSITIDTMMLRAPYNPAPIAGWGYGYAASADGSYIARLSEKRRIKGLHGAHSVQLRHAAHNGQLLLLGSSAGFLYGQNVFGHSNARIAGFRALMKACRTARILVSDEQAADWKSGNFELHRLDLAINLQLRNDAEVKDALQQIARQLIEQRCETWVMYSSVYWMPKKAEAYGITFYAKGPQLAQRRYGKDDMVLRRLAEECAGVLRVELRLKRPALMELQLNKGSAWNSAIAREVLQRYLGRLPLLDVLSGPNFTDRWPSLSLAHRRAVVAAASGIPLDQLYAQSTVSKVKTDLRKIGLDLNPPYRRKPVIQVASLLDNPKHILRTPQWLIDERRAPARKRRITAS